MAGMSGQAWVERLKRDPEVREALDKSFDFIVTDEETDISWFSVEPNASMRVIGRSASGGVFVLYGDQENVLHVTSEGQAGIVAGDLGEFLQLLVKHPYWLSLLKFS